MNLINDPWIPIRRRSGGRERIEPWRITEGLDGGDPVVALDAPRADFNGALVQFLIGLLQSTAPTKGEGIPWREWYERPPAPELLRRRLEPLAHAFELFGEGPRFMQDLEPLDDEPKEIGALLIEAPGGNTLRNNTDHFIKRGGVETLCPACAATALFTLQTNAPSGGVGHRTSLRGGGPLTTLVVPDGDESAFALWHTLWLNVLERETFLKLSRNPGLTKDSDRFPWLAPTRTSEAKTGRDTTPEDVHPDQLFWAMPRRIRLEDSSAREGRCDLCGDESDHLLSHFRTRNYGVNYTGAWLHPLSPYLRDPQKGPLPLHPQPGGINYRHWLGLIVRREGDKGSVTPAEVVHHHRTTRERGRGQPLRVWAFGFDMDNMKARCWYEGRIPLYETDPEWAREFDADSAALVQAANLAALSLRGALKQAWFSARAEARGDLSFVDASFWQRTEPDFHAALRQLREALAAEAEAEALRKGWRDTLRRHAEALFDHWVMSGPIEDENPRRIADAFGNLRGTLLGKKMAAILDLPVEKRTGKAA